MSTSSRERLLDKFRDVTRQRLAEIERGLVSLGQPGSPIAPAVAEALARQLHTLKGEANMMGFPVAAGIAHELEDRLGATLRDAQAPQPEVLDGVFADLDRLLADVETRDGDDASADARALPPVAGANDALEQISDRVTDLALHTTQLAARLDELEAVAARASPDVAAAIVEIATAARDHAREAESTSVELLAHVRDLQLVPLADGLVRYPRAIRDLGRELGKEVRLEIEVGSVRIDRDVLEQLADPLLHVLRNAVDHGCEAAARRRAQSKPEASCIRVVAQRVGSDIVIEIRDDGRGIDPDRVLDLARRRGRIGPEDAIDPADALQLLLLPGMSTREEVNEVSGRGVGLDVVRERIETLGGYVSLHSTPGLGTTVTLAVPVSSMLVDALVVEVGPCRFAVPLEAVEEIIGHDDDRVAPVGDTVALHHDGKLLPLRDLGDLVGGGSEPADRHVLIVRRGAQRSALVVDRVLGERQVVLRGNSSFIARSRFVRDIGISTDGVTTLLLDLAAATTSDSPRRHKPTPASVGSKPARARLKVVVADDSELTRDMLVRALRTRGYEVIEAVDGTDALTKIEQHRPAAVFTDLDMPRLDGFGLMQRLRARPMPQRPQVVVFSTHADPTHIARATQLGAVGYLVKAQFESRRLDDLLDLVFRDPAHGDAGGP